MYKFKHYFVVLHWAPVCCLVVSWFVFSFPLSSFLLGPNNEVWSYVEHNKVSYRSKLGRSQKFLSKLLYQTQRNLKYNLKMQSLFPRGKDKSLKLKQAMSCCVALKPQVVPSVLQQLCFQLLKLVLCEEEKKGR